MIINKIRKELQGKQREFYLIIKNYEDDSTKTFYALNFFHKILDEIERDSQEPSENKVCW